MSNQIFTNNASTTLGSAAGAGDTTMTVATGTGGEFPALSGAEYFVATLWASGSSTGVPNEIVRVTARVGDTMTVVRGQEGTTAQAWNVGDTFALYPTAAFYNGIIQEGDIQLQGGNSAVDVGTANAGAIVLDPAITSLSQILYAPVRVLKMASANTGAYTLNVNGLGVKAVKIGGNPLANGQLPANLIYEVVWDGTQFDLISAPANIPNVQLAQMVAQTVKANLTGASATPTDVPMSSFLSALGVSSVIGGSTIVLDAASVVVQASRTTTIPGNTTTVCPFPQTFPNACIACVCSPMDDGANQDNGLSIRSWTNSSVTIENGNTGSLTPGIIAIGH